jgi:hypothetical protein
MNWQDVGNFVAAAAPTLGGFLMGPAGEKVGELVSSILGVQNSPDKVLEALKNSPDALVKIKEIEANRQIELSRIALGESGEETKQLASVNETMQIESDVSRSDRVAAFLTSTWRPFWGFVAGIAFGVVAMFVCFLAYRAVVEKDAAAFAMIPSFISSMTLLFSIPGGILGVASWHRGMMQRGK